MLYELARMALDVEEPQAVRVEAVRGMGKNGRGSAEVTRILLRLLDGRDYRVRVAALEALEELDDSASTLELGAYYDTCVFPRERRILERILRGRG